MLASLLSETTQLLEVVPVTSRLAKVAISALAAILVMVGIPSVASAEPTGNYKYTCVTPGQADWSIPKGQALSNCNNAYIYVRINGQLVDVIPTNIDGLRVERQVVSASKVWCIVGIVGSVYAVMTTAGTAGWIIAGLGGASTIATCRA